MKKILFLLLALPFLATAQPVTTSITSDGSVVTIATPVNSKQCSVCNFNWVIVDGNLRIWITGSNEVVPGGRLKFFTVSGVTDNSLKDEALGAISDQCDQGGSGGGGQTVLLQESTSTAGTSTSNNYHKGKLGIGDFSSSNIQAKMHLYDVAQAIFRISDEAASDTAAIAYVDFWRGKNTARLGRVGYLFNTDNDLYLRNESTGGAVKIQTNGVDNVTIPSTGNIQLHAYGQGAMVGDTSGTVYLAGFDANGNMTDETSLASLAPTPITSGAFAIGNGTGIEAKPHANLSGYVAKFGSRDATGAVGGLDIRGYDLNQKILWNFQNGGAITNTVFFHNSIENTQTGYYFPKISMTTSRFTGSTSFNNVASVTGQMAGNYGFARSNGSGTNYQYGFYGICKSGNDLRIVLNGGDNGSAADTVSTNNTVEWNETSKLQINYGDIALGGQSSSFAKISKTGPVVNFKLADGSDDATITVNQLRVKNYTVATLPTGVTGSICYVTDALAPTYRATVTGGGGERVLVFYNGSNWICH